MIITNSVVYGQQNFDFPSHMNYGKFLLDILLKYKDKVALINADSEENVTYKEIAEKIINTAAGLIRVGVKRGDVVAICSENRPEFLITSTAVAYIGGVVTFINYNYSQDDLRHTLNISKPKYMFMSATTYNTHYIFISKLNIIKGFFVFGECDIKHDMIFFNDLAEAYVDECEYVNFGGQEQTTLILYSSGTTGLPKGAKLTNKNLIAAGLQPLPSERSLVCLITAPWSNTLGIICTTDRLINGQTVVYLNKYTETKYVETIQKYKVGFLVAVPTLIISICKSTILNYYDVSSVELIYCGGSPLDVDVIDEVKTRLPNLKYVLQCYGMTEATGSVTEELETAPKQGSVGRVVPGIILKITDTKTEKALGPGHMGEVRIKGVTVFGGYIGKDYKDDFDDDGFYKTGDIAYYDDEGYFYIIDRLKELIKYKAWQVAPTELETILLKHPAVKDAAVIGTPDPVAGELPTGFVVKKDGIEASEKDIMDFVGAKVSPWKQLRGGVKFVKEIPKAPSGKILRRILRESRNPIRSKL